LRRQNKARLIVVVESISRAFSVEIEADCVRPVDRRSPCSLPAPYVTLCDYSRDAVQSAVLGAKN
jgi:hypothetical protein